MGKVGVSQDVVYPGLCSVCSREECEEGLAVEHYVFYTQCCIWSFFFFWLGLFLMSQIGVGLLDYVYVRSGRRMSGRTGDGAYVFYIKSGLGLLCSIMLYLGYLSIQVFEVLRSLCCCIVIYISPQVYYHISYKLCLPFIQFIHVDTMYSFY